MKASYACVCESVNLAVLCVGVGSEKSSLYWGRAFFVSQVAL